LSYRIQVARWLAEQAFGKTPAVIHEIKGEDHCDLSKLSDEEMATLSKLTNKAWQKSEE
jgi:hypothetical protein